MDFNPVVSSISARVEPLTLAKIYTQLVSSEQRINLQQDGGSGSSAHTATRGGRGASAMAGAVVAVVVDAAAATTVAPTTTDVINRTPTPTSASSVAERDTPSSAASNALTPPLQGSQRSTRRQQKPHPTMWIQIGTPIPVLLIISQENWRNSP